MSKFVRIASIRRGAIEPAEVLNDPNQHFAEERLAHDEPQLGEIVVWHHNEPRSVPETNAFTAVRRMPRVSRELLAQLQGPRVVLDDEWTKRSRRAGVR